jgi:restriction system protein
MKGTFKRVQRRRDDALARVAWDRLETMLAEHYRSLGYTVDHVGTGATGRNFDGGIDLKLQRNDEYVVVQCKHWNAYKVPHNDVHQLLGIMVNEGATDAILVTSGEFTKAAIEAAGRLGHVQLVDGDELRAMLGPLAEDEPSAQRHRMVDGAASGVGRLTATVAERLLVAAEDRIRYGSRRRSRSRDALIAGALLAPLLKLALAGALLIAGLIALPAMIRSAFAPSATSATRVTLRGTSQPLPRRTQTAAAAPKPNPVRASVVTVVDTAGEMSAAELREWKKRNEESMKILESTTPEY